MSTYDADREAELAAESLDSGDAALRNAIRAVFDESDPVPDGLIDRVEFELTLDALTAEVATLITMDLATAHVRSAASRGLAPRRVP